MNITQKNYSIKRIKEITELLISNLRDKDNKEAKEYRDTNKINFLDIQKGLKTGKVKLNTLTQIKSNLLNLTSFNLYFKHLINETSLNLLQVEKDIKRSKLSPPDLTNSCCGKKLLSSINLSACYYFHYQVYYDRANELLNECLTACDTIMLSNEEEALNTINKFNNLVP